jgi:integrase
MTKPLPLKDENLSKLTLGKGEADRTFWDIPSKGIDPVTGFGLRVREGGSRVYILRYKHEGQTRRIVLGEAGLFKTVDAARAVARDKKGAVIEQRRAGVDPRSVEKARREEIQRSQARAEAGAFLLQAKAYIEHKTGKIRPKTLYETKRYLIGLDNAAPAVWQPLHGMALNEITQRVVKARLAEIAAVSGTVTADRARAALSGFFVWAVDREQADANPVMGIKPATDAEDMRRERVLSDAELKAIWHKVPAGDYGDIVRLLILTGQRPNEIAGATWQELAIGPEVTPERRTLALPRERTKNGLPHDVPLSESAAAILEGRTAIVGRDYVFGEGSRGYQGWSKSKAALDEKLGFNEPWQLRDIRRTVVTGMSELGILPHVVEAVVNHVSGDAKRGVAGVYNKAKYGPEKREALDRWAAHVTALVALKEAAQAA